MSQISFSVNQVAIYNGTNWQPVFNVEATPLLCRWFNDKGDYILLPICRTQELDDVLAMDCMGVRVVWPRRKMGQTILYAELIMDEEGWGEIINTVAGLYNRA